MQSVEFYQAHLDGVSRSFAFCIRKLKDPLRRWVSLSYLLCRALDTVEDSPWADAGLQSRQYAEFEGFLHARPSPEQVAAWASRFSQAIPGTEKKLLDDAFHLFDDLHGLPARVTTDIRETVLRMSRGMRHYSAAHLRLHDLKDVNQYCYFVAGIVGELLTRLFVSYRPDFRPGPDFMKDAFHFGLFLQKVNLLKDQLGDEKEGRYLVPDRAQVLASLRDNARGSLRYLTALPADEIGYRTFCAWSLFLGLASMPWIQESFEKGGGIKIPRDATQALLEEIEAIVGDDGAILSHGEECLALIPELSAPMRQRVPETTGLAATAGAPVGGGSDDAWFHRISGGVLAPSELAELGITA
jgi:phytoene/squalene synthetase